MMGHVLVEMVRLSTSYLIVHSCGWNGEIHVVGKMNSVHCFDMGIIDPGRNYARGLLGRDK